MSEITRFNCVQDPHDQLRCYTLGGGQLQVDIEYANTSSKSVILSNEDVAKLADTLNKHLGVDMEALAICLESKAEH